MLPFLFLASGLAGTSCKPVRHSLGEKAFLEMCAIELLPAGKLARFQSVAIYRLRTDSEGRVKEVDPVRVADFLQRMVRLDLLGDCLRRWRLAANAEYTVAVHLGSGVETKLTIQRLGGGSLTIFIPWANGQANR